MVADYLKLYEGFFNDAIKAADEIALRYFRKNITVDIKKDHSPVTQADREIEQRLRGMITKTFPGHGIIGEEFGRENDRAEFVWAIDPIDGTKAFITGKPLFGTIIGLLHNGKPVMGAVSQPFTKEYWLGVMDTYATHNGQPIKVAAPRTLDAARLFTGSPIMFAGPTFEPWLKLCNMVKVPQYSCDCYAYGLVAMGCADIAIEQHLKIYDVAGIVPIVTGAGGFASDWKNCPVGMNFDGHVVMSSTKELAMQALGIMNDI
jgi:inositol-phosphate phosphatase/L-galactose 1-phosphate phosphatase/histidinol-phosphatase